MKKILLLLIFCSSSVGASEPALVPRPAKIVSGNGDAQLPAALVYGSCPQEAESAVAFYNRMGKGLQSSMEAGSEVNLELTVDASLGAEAYTLTAAGNRVQIAAADKAIIVKSLMLCL